MRKTLVLPILLLFFLKFSSHVFAIPGGVSGGVYYQLPNGTRGPLPGVKISRMELWGWGEAYCDKVPDQYKSNLPDHCWGYFNTVETTSDNEGNYTMANEGNNPAPIAAKKEEYEDGSYTIITKCLAGERGRVPVCRITPTNAPIIPSTSYINCPDPNWPDYDPNQMICVDPPITCGQFNWCGFSCGYIQHRWGPYFPQGYRLPGNLENLGYSHRRGKWYRYIQVGDSIILEEGSEYMARIGNSGNFNGHDFIFILDPPVTPTPTSTPTPTNTSTPTPTRTPTPYLVIKVKDIDGNSRLAEKMALTYSCPGVSFCKQGEDVTLKSEATFPYSGGSNKGGGIVVSSFHQLLGVTPIPNTGGSLRAMSVPCNGINCSEIWQNYWWNNFPNTGQASLDYVVYVYPTPSLGELIIKADNTRDSTSGPYGFSGMRREDSRIVNGISQFGRNQYNYLVVGQVINSNIQSSQNLNLDPKANIGLGGVIFGPRGAVSFNPNDPASILAIVKNSKGFIMLYSEKSIPISERKHLLRNSNIKIEKDYFYFYVPTDNNFTSYQWVKMPNDPQLLHKILSNDKEVFSLGVSDSCYDEIDEKISVPCFRLYFYSGFLSNQQKEIYWWGTYGYVYDHLRDQNFIEKKRP
jgi:hypothetical protein